MPVWAALQSPSCKASYVMKKEDNLQPFVYKKTRRVLHSTATNICGWLQR